MHHLILVLYIISLSVLFLFGIHGLFLLYHYKKKPKNKVAKPPLSIALPLVTIQLPIYNEPNVIERLIRSTCKIRYPIDKLEIQILDDSTDETSSIAIKLVNEYKHKGFNINYIRRPNRIGFKAGALREGLSVCGGEFIAIFDADFVPSENFLEETISFFVDAKIGLVQTRWSHLNENHSILTKVQAFVLDTHFCLEQQVRYSAGFFFGFNGTAGIWRKQAILDAGN